MQSVLKNNHSTEVALIHPGAARPRHVWLCPGPVAFLSTLSPACHSLGCAGTRGTSPQDRDPDSRSCPGSAGRCGLPGAPGSPRAWRCCGDKTRQESEVLTVASCRQCIPALVLTPKALLHHPITPRRTPHPSPAGHQVPPRCAPWPGWDPDPDTTPCPRGKAPLLPSRGTAEKGNTSVLAEQLLFVLRSRRASDGLHKPRGKVLSSLAAGDSERPTSCG